MPSPPSKPRRRAPAKAKPSIPPAPKPRRRAPAKTKPSVARARAQSTAKLRPAKAKRPAARRQDPAPRQGFETESDPISGSVRPPGGVDLFTSAAELAGELAKTGLFTGGRLLKDVLARLPLN